MRGACACESPVSRASLARCLLLALCLLSTCLAARVQAQCGILLQEEGTIPQDAAAFRCSILFDSDGPGPLPPELLVGADKGRVFAWNGTRWRQFGPPMADSGVSYTEPSDPQVFQLLNFRGELHAVTAGSISSTNGSIFRWNGTSWVAAPRISACGVGLLSGWFLAATVHNDEIIVAGQSLRCGNQNATALAWNGTSWRRVGDTPFSTTSVYGALLSTSTGRLLLGGVAQRNSPAESVLISELVNNAWVTRQTGSAGGTSIAVMRLQELNGEVLACGAMALNFSTPPVRVLRETPTGWERADPYNAAAVPAMEIAHHVFVDGDRTFVAGGVTADGRGVVVLLTPQSTTTLTLPYNGVRRLSGGVARYGDRYFALGGAPGGAVSPCPLSQRILTADVVNPLAWSTLSPLLAPNGDRSVVGTVASHAGDTLISLGNVGGAPFGILRPNDCNVDSTYTTERSLERWLLPAERLGSQARQLLVYNNQIHALGAFTGVSTRPLTNGIARWDGNAWQSFPVAISPSGVNLIAGVVWNNQLVVVDSRTAGTTVRRFDGTQWSPIGPAFPGGIEASIAAVGNRLIFAYNNRVLEWDGTAWVRLGDDTNTPQVRLVSSFSNQIIISAFQSASIPAVQIWTGTTWQALGTQISTVRALREFNGALYAGMQGPVVTGQSPLMRLDGNTWVPAVPNPRLILSDPSAVQTVYALFPEGDTLHIAGEFNLLGGLPFESYARFYAGPPRVLTPPAAAFAVENRTAYFSIEPEVYHDPTQTYQWQRNGQPLANGTTPTGSNIAGATSLYLRVQHATSADAGDYSIVVTNACASTTSSAAALTITCPADLDDGTGTGTPDGGVTIDDLLYYLDQYAQGTARADLDDGSTTGTPDGGVTIDDLLYYLQRFEAGC